MRPSATGPTLCFWIEMPPHETERLVAELFSMGTLGLEEREGSPSGGEGGGGGRTLLLAYFSAAQAPVSEILALGDGSREISVQPPEPVPERDWLSAWRAGLAPRRIGPLWIRPSWCESRGAPEIQIDPEQAFGSGEHASTRLALELVLEVLQRGDRVLDLGTGSGILGLAALRLGAGRALGLDIDRAACADATRNAARNRLGLALVCGTLETIGPGEAFEIVVANLLWRGLEPWLPRLAGHSTRALVLSGYLLEERDALHERLAARGLWPVRELEEWQSGDTWCASRWAQGPALHWASSSSSVSSKG